MKRRIFFALLLVIAAFFVGRQVKRFKAGHADEPGRQETRQSFRLDPGARVEVKGINGSVEINTSETDTADVRVAYEAANPEDLEGRRVVVEHTESELIVRGEGQEGAGGIWRWLNGGGDVRVAVILNVPRRVSVTAKGVNGPVEVGEVEGALEVSGVNGRAELVQSGGRAEVSGVNGNVTLRVARLAPEGFEVKGVNGNVEISLASAADADLEVKGHNGNVSLNLPNVTMQERETHGRLRARFGAGGAPLTVKGVNGNVRFDSDAPAAAVVPVMPTGALPPPPPPPAPVAPRVVVAPRP